MSYYSGWDFEDTLEDFIYPSSKKELFALAFYNLITYPVLVLAYIPLSYLVSFFMGLGNINSKRRCDCCGKMKLGNVRSLQKFEWFCESCSDKYDKVVKKLKKEVKHDISR